MKTIHLATSDLAKLTGHNTYEPLQNTIDKILVRNNLSSKFAFFICICISTRKYGCCILHRIQLYLHCITLYL